MDDDYLTFNERRKATPAKNPTGTVDLLEFEDLTEHVEIDDQVDCHVCCQAVCDCEKEPD